MSIEKAKEFVRDNHGSTLKDDRMSDSPWISVEDRLPPDGMMIDVVSCNVRLTDVYFERGKLADELPEFVIGVTHWMPIPDSPK